ncbi:unnamed protein product [Albugo candida]|uniref:Uncharacterized protein n=1 Tax=Albugo candida TaxID=65357 RepID=A0A024GRN5_9STRA|nr:unnamed protein product [Albugo candida]|eukprot:CCI49415.1 unnamed protein product [Albugo candida]
MYHLRDASGQISCGCVKTLDILLQICTLCFRVLLERNPHVNLAPLSERADEGVDPVRCKARQYTLEHGQRTNGTLITIDLG